MKTVQKLSLLLLILASLLILARVFSHAQWKKTPLQAPVRPNPQLYRADANAAEEIREALVSAGKQNKRVLLDFGGNWCLDCHVLDNAFHQPRIAPLLNANFILVHVDIGKYDKNLDLAKKYRADLEKGVPSLAVLDGHGTVLYSTFDFERARVMSEEDVIGFLEKWKPQATAKKRALTSKGRFPKWDAGIILLTKDLLIASKLQYPVFTNSLLAVSKWHQKQVVGLSASFFSNQDYFSPSSSPFC